MQHNSLLYRLLLDPFTHGIACTIVAYLVAPTQFIKVVYQETGASYTSIITKHVRARNFRVFYAGAHIYALRQFIAAFAFGISQWLFLFSLRYPAIINKTLSFIEYAFLAIIIEGSLRRILKAINSLAVLNITTCCLTATIIRKWSILPYLGSYFSNFTLLIIWQCFLAGIVETVITAYSETKEIAANKGDLMKRKEAVRDIFMPILLRNTLAGSAAILAYELTKNMDGFFMNMVVSTFLGIVASALTMPFDLIATQNCGSEVRMTWIGRLKQNILVEKKFRRVIFNGLTMRILQIVPYSIAHSLVMLLLVK